MAEAVAGGVPVGADWWGDGGSGGCGGGGLTGLVDQGDEEGGGFVIVEVESPVEEAFVDVDFAVLDFLDFGGEGGIEARVVL